MRLGALVVGPVVALALALSGTARAEGELRVSWPVDLAITGGTRLLLVISDAFFLDDLAPSSCRWCGSNGLDEGARDAFLWDDAGRADFLSDAGYLATPLVSAGLLAIAAGVEGRLGGWPEDTLVMLEAMNVTAFVTYGVKLVAGRRRPNVHHGTSTEDLGSNTNLSFFSGHTSSVFSVAVSAGTVASIRGYRLAPAIWATGLTFAAATGYLRVAADEHYFTDVLAGAVVGSAIGFAVPWLFHRAERRPALTVLPGPVVSLSGRF